MRRVNLLITLLAAGALVLGTGYAFAQQSTTTPSSAATSATPSTTGASSAATMPEKPALVKASKQKAMAPESEGAKESTAQQRSEAKAASTEKAEKERTMDRASRGQVAHVDTTAHPNTLVMNTMLGHQDLTVGVDVLPSTKITQGRTTKTLADIKQGDQIWMKWDRTANRLVADQIRILGTSSKVSAKAEESETAAKAMPAAPKSAEATPAAAKTEAGKKSY